MFKSVKEWNRIAEGRVEASARGLAGGCSRGSRMLRAEAMTAIRGDSSPRPPDQHPGEARIERNWAILRPRSVRW